MKQFLKGGFLMLILAANGCVTAPKPSGETSLEQIKERLQMIRHLDDLGFSEKPFDECELGFKNDQCEKEFLTIIHFRLLCRESEGTVGSVPETVPVMSNAIKWKVGEIFGVTQTDAMGFGKIEFKSPRSSAKSRMRLTIEDRFVAVPAIEVSRMVVPKDWCL